MAKGGGISLRQNSRMKDHATAVLGEILGTAMFLFIVSFSLRVHNATKSDS